MSDDVPIPPRPFNATDIFYRQIPQEFVNARKGRISAAAFQNTTGTMDLSVDWALLCTPAQSMLRRPNRAVGQFSKRVCDEQRQMCVYDPVHGNDAHCTIRGEKPEPVRAAFARATRIVLAPNGFEVPVNLWLTPSG